MLPAFSAAAEGSSDLIGAILSNLPAKDSAGYRDLYLAAGRPFSETLVMSQSEMWNVLPANWQRFQRAAKKLGVKATRLDKSWNHALVPMAGGKPMTASQQSMMHDAMSSKAATGMSMMALPSAAIVEHALTKGMNATGAEFAQETLVLPLTDGHHVAVRRTSITKVSGGWAWHGVTEETGEPATLLWWPTGKMTGQVTYRSMVYAIHHMGDSMHGIVQMNPNAMPQDHSVMGSELRQKMHYRTDPLATKGDASQLMQDLNKAKRQAASPLQSDNRERPDVRNQEDAAPGQTVPADKPAMSSSISKSAIKSPAEPVTIRVLVAYTASAARRYHDIESDLIALAIEEANQSFRNSGINNVRLEVVHAYQTPYVESATHFEHVFRFANQRDGYIDEVHALRSAHKADVALLVVHDPNGCGLAAEVFAKPERAFAVVHHECAANMYSVAHEIGHLIGARHDLALDDSIEPFAFGHGYVHNNEWRTIMSYKDSCGGCMRLPIWSNPEVMVRGIPAGNSSSNNARVIAENAARVAKFHLTLENTTANAGDINSQAVREKAGDK